MPAAHETPDGKTAGKEEMENMALSIKKLAGGFGALAKVEAPDVLPPLVGGTATIVSLLMIRKFSKDPASRVRTLAPLIAIVPGIVVSLPLNWWGRGGVRAVVSSAVTSVAMGAGVFLYEWASTKSWMTSGMGRLAQQRMAVPPKQLKGLQVQGGRPAQLPVPRKSLIPVARTPIGATR